MIRSMILALAVACTGCVALPDNMKSPMPDNEEHPDSTYAPYQAQQYWYATALEYCDDPDSDDPLAIQECT